MPELTAAELLPIQKPAEENDWVVDMLRSPSGQALLRQPERMGLLSRWRIGREAAEFQKAVGRRALQWSEEKVRAREQGAVVNETFYQFGMYDSLKGVKETTGATFAMLRLWAHSCEPYAAIESRRIAQVCSFSNPVMTNSGFVKEPGFRFKMTVPDAEPSEKNKAEMRELCQFISETGWCEPPADEKPENYQQGFRSFLQQFVRDTLCMDWTAIRTWQSADKVFGKKWPIVSFSCIDSGRIRRVRDPIKGLERGVERREEWAGKVSRRGGSY